MVIQVFLCLTLLALTLRGEVNDLTIHGATAEMTNFFVQSSRGTQNNFTGNVGYEFIPRATIQIVALGRSINGNGSQGNHLVTIWSVATRQAVAQVTVAATSKLAREGFAFELLADPVTLEKGHIYRITSNEEAGGDPIVDISAVRQHLAIADITAGIYTEDDGFPASFCGGIDQAYGLPTFFFEKAGVDRSLTKISSQEPRPLIRDIQTGYLLNCFFMSPKPYCWSGKDCMLSGWDVDRSGGTFAFHPTCLYPEGFAFNSDWFKLQDTSSKFAVTLKHQLARQTEGLVTVEFRFKLPARMDGACWQLRDMKQAGVSLLTANGNLCYQGANGQMVTLQPIEADWDYGVKVVADITTKTADVYIDGLLKAQGLPFMYPISTVDYILIKTGDSATGEMYLDPVNVYIGYAVNETFVTDGVGQMPSDWAIESGMAKVETFECGTRPDIFSLKLDSVQGRPAVVSKDFSPIRNKTVFNFRFLLPTKVNGFRAELGDGSVAGVRLVTAGGDLCYVNDQGQTVPLMRDYRANLWYMVKVVADPKAHTADLYVNGKVVATQLPLHRGPEAFDNLRFASAAAEGLWIDDVQVYPWRDYPADYVPPPKACPAKSDYLLGVQSCNLWREGKAYAGWDYIYPYRAQRKPYLGWYDEGNSEETDWEIKWEVEHGIGFEMHCWYRPNNAVNHPIKDGVLDQGIIQGLFNARYSHFEKFAIMCTDEGACETNPDDFKNNIIPYWIEYFFKDPRYLKIDGKPILSIYSYGNWTRMFGGEDGGHAAIEMLRTEISKAGFPGIIVMMEERSGTLNALRAIKALGADYCYSYTWETPDAKVERAKMLKERDACSIAGINVIPSISMGWNREAWGVQGGGWLSVADYQALSTWTRDQYMPSLPEDSLGRCMVLLANWNEFGEGHFIMPSNLHGFGYLDALREVYTTNPPHKDCKPTEKQKSRFTVLFPKE